MIPRPWWLPKGSDPARMPLVWDVYSGCEFSGSPEQFKFSPIVLREPMVIFDRVLNESEVAFAIWAMGARHSMGMAMIYAMKPTHVRYKGDVDEDGVCRCSLCRSKEATDERRH